MILTLASLSLMLVQAPGPIEQVIVFSDRAEVTRKATTPCSGKTREVTFEGLPTTMDSRTLRAHADQPASIEGLTHRVVALLESLDERRAKLDKERDGLLDDMKALQDEAAELAERAENARGYGTYLRGILSEDLRNTKPSMPMWKQGLEFLAKEDLGSRQDILQKNIQVRTLARRLEQVERALSTLHSSPSSEAVAVTVAVRCSGANQAAVHLSYVLPGATWHPEYDVRFFANDKSGLGKGSVALTVSAVVQQATGEDWEDVKLILSTAKPKLGAEAPLPAPLWVNGHAAGDEKVMVQGQERRENLRASSNQGGGGPASAELEDGGKSFTLQLPHRVTVRADGRPYWMPVDETRTKGEVKLVAIPKVQPYVYRTLKLENPAAYPLMAGKLHSFRAQAFMGSTQLDYTAPGAPMEVSLGIDGDFDVEREVMHKQDRKPTLLSNSRRFEHHYRVRVFNQSRVRAKVEVRENMPVSKDENIKVELDREKTMRGVMVDGHRGFVTLEVAVAAGKDEAADLAYTISLPKDWQVQ